VRPAQIRTVRVDGAFRRAETTRFRGFDGATGFLMHRHDALAWAVLVNTRRAHSNMEKELHELSWRIADALQPQSRPYSRVSEMRELERRSPT
jgi:hypothetical protein